MGLRFAAGDSGTRAGAESFVVADVRGVTSLSLSVLAVVSEPSVSSCQLCTFRSNKCLPEYTTRV